MNEVLAQAQSLNAEWIIGGLASAFCAFAIWVGKFLKQIWADIKVIWIEFKKMHTQEIETLEAVIEKQEDSNKKAHDRTTKILSKTMEIERHVAETKYSVNGFRGELESIKEKLSELEDFHERIKTINIDNCNELLERVRDT